MIRIRAPGGVFKPQQWLKLDQIATTYANHSLRVTTRQTFQIHGVIKRELKATMQAINAALIDTLAACGDVNRNVLVAANPLVSQALAIELQSQYPDLVAYPQADGQMKLAAGWLIDKAGWKGFREGDAGVHKLQALVLVNYGGATGHDIANLARRIQRDIAERFKVELEMEPNQY